MLFRWGIWASVLGFGVAGLVFYSSKTGKLRVRNRLLDQLALRGDEDVLDLGSGLMLLGAATRTPAGSGTGIDLWRARDQAGQTASSA